MFTKPFALTVRLFANMLAGHMVITTLLLLIALMAEMSCIAGVGGKVAPLVKKANSARQVIAIDGCPLACSWACLNNAGRIPDLHIDLSRLGLPKLMHMDPAPRDLDRAMLVARFELGKLNPLAAEKAP
jgi:uncharacterized metal-binding protein